MPIVFMMSPQWFQGTAQLAHGAENRLLARADVQRKGLGYGFERLAFVMTHDERGALERRHARQLIFDLAADLATERMAVRCRRLVGAAGEKILAVVIGTGVAERDAVLAVA